MPARRTIIWSLVNLIYGRLIFSGRRKSRCSGTLPCHRCSQLSIPCKYDSPHKRGQPSSPPRGNSIPPDRQSNWPVSQPQQPQPVTLSSDTLAVPTSESRQTEAAAEALHSSRSSPGRDATNVEGQYIGPTSGLAFLHRAKGRLRQDFSSSTRNAVDTPRAPSSIFTFGDKPYPNYSGLTLVLPSRQQAREHVKRYFEFAIPTYRFLHQGTLEGWLEKFMNENETTGNGAKPLNDRKAAVVLMVLATSMLYRVDDTAAFHDKEAEEYDQR
jgi:Fungal Zn(2)-Cys(6) binuclear cluster domain